MDLHALVTLAVHVNMHIVWYPSGGVVLAPSKRCWGEGRQQAVTFTFLFPSPVEPATSTAIHIEPDGPDMTHCL